MCDSVSPLHPQPRDKPGPRSASAKLRGSKTAPARRPSVDSRRGLAKLELQYDGSDCAPRGFDSPFRSRRGP